MKKLFLTFAFAFASFAITPAIYAQDEENTEENGNSDASNKSKFWEAKLPGGEFIVSLSRISSISSHSYIISNTNYVVHEAVVDTFGSAIARFYAIELISESSDANFTQNLTELTKNTTSDLGSRAGFDPNTVVEKSNPQTTHAKTIEYRLASKSDIEDLIKSAKKAWKDNRGRKFVIK